MSFTESVLQFVCDSYGRPARAEARTVQPVGAGDVHRLLAGLDSRNFQTGSPSLLKSEQTTDECTRALSRNL